jgi:hypothetical protein
VTSTGTLPSLVRLYGTTGGTGLDAYLDLVVTRGSQPAPSFDDCAGFVPESSDWTGAGPGIVYSGTLAAFGDNWAGATVDPIASRPEAWTTGETHTYRFDFTLQGGDGAQGLTATQQFTWEARNTTSYSQVVASDGPVGYWQLDESGGSNGADIEGRHDVSFIGDPVLGRPGVRDAGTSVEFDSAADYAQVGDYWDFTGTAPFSVSFWMKPSSTYATTYNGRPVSKENYVNATTIGGWTFILNQNSGGNARKLMFERHDGGSGVSQVTSPGALTYGTWYHVVGTYDGATMRLYLDGAEIGNVASALSLPDHSYPLQFARQGGNRYGGNLDEIAIYDKALSAAQVQGLYGAGRP